MPDEITPPEEGEVQDVEPTDENAAIAEATDADIEAVAAKAENPDAVRRALKAERETAKKAQKDLADALARVKEFEDAQKTEAERQAERMAELEKRSAELERENVRLEVAHEKKLPPELARRLQGENREELEADADQLLALVTKTPVPRGDADLGARKGGKHQLSREALQKMKPEEIAEALQDGRLDSVLGRA